MREWLYPARIEIYQSHQSISNERKRFVTQGIKFCAMLCSEFKAANQSDYDLCITLQIGFISNILSLPTVNNYLIPLIKEGLKIDWKLVYQSYYFHIQEEESKSSKKN